MASHDHFRSVCIDVLLLNRDRLCKNVEASAHQIYEENLMVSYDAEDSFIVIAAHCRSKVDFDTNKRMGFDASFSHCETEDIELLSNELKAYWQI